MSYLRLSLGIVTGYFRGANWETCRNVSELVWNGMELGAIATSSFLISFWFFSLDGGDTKENTGAFLCYAVLSCPVSVLMSVSGFLVSYCFITAPYISLRKPTSKHPPFPFLPLLLLLLSSTQKTRNDRLCWQQVDRRPLCISLDKDERRHSGLLSFPFPLTHHTKPRGILVVSCGESPIPRAHTLNFLAPRARATGKVSC